MENKKDKPILAEEKTLPDGVKVIILGCGREDITEQITTLIHKEKGTDILILTKEEAKEKGIHTALNRGAYESTATLIPYYTPVINPLKIEYAKDFEIKKPIDAIMGKNKKKKKW